jgi:hypothetical protein
MRLLKCIFHFIAFAVWGALLIDIPSVGAEGMLLYKPPSVGAPKGRIGCGTRGLAKESPLSLLVPKHIGLTSQASPSLFWYSSKTEDKTMEFVLTRQDNHAVVLEKKLAGIAGARSLRLKDYGILLQSGIEYNWLISLVGDSPRDDVVVSGAIQYRPFAGRLVSAEDAARQGYWYDAVEMLMKDASNQARQRLESLLEQGGVQLPQGVTIGGGECIEE